jgi:transposase
MLPYRKKENRIADDCETCLKRFEGIVADLQKQIKFQAEEIKELRERVNKNSRNSNKPPSTDDPFKKQTKSLRTKSGKKPGGQAGHKGSTLHKVDNPDIIIVHSLKRCSCCGKNLENIKVRKTESRQVFDIQPIKIDVTEHRAEEKRCPNCGIKTKAEFPEDVVNPTQYGKNIMSFSIYLKNFGFVSYERIAEMFNDFLGIKISQGTLQKFDIEAAKKLEGFEKVLKDKLFRERVLHVDESGMRIMGKLNWVHNISSGNFTLYYPHIRRGFEAVKDNGILPRYKGVLIHDAWSSYWKMLKCQHGLCNIHHLRELDWMDNNENQDWAYELSKLLLKIKSDKEKQFPIPEKRMKRYSEKYDNIIESGYEFNPIQKWKRGITGKKKRGKIVCLLDRLKDRKDSVLLFMHKRDVPFGNNQAEQDIRMVKVQQKVSGTFRSWSGAIAFCRIRSFISTVRKHGKSCYFSILDTLKGNCLNYMAE